MRCEVTATDHTDKKLLFHSPSFTQIQRDYTVAIHHHHHHLSCSSSWINPRTCLLFVCDVNKCYIVSSDLKTEVCVAEVIVMLEMKGVFCICLDLCCLIIVGLPFAVLNIQHKPFKRGFFCSDDSIKYPYKDDTISYQLLMGIMIPFTLLVITCAECFSVYLRSRASFSYEYIACVYKTVGSFVFGAALSQSLTDIAKYSIGRLRPHFLTVCKPNWSLIDCKSGYIENFTCTGDPTVTSEARLSFYSGHSSFSMYCMLFLTLYLQSRLTAGWSRLLRPTLQFFFISTSLYVGLTRVSDYKHHWSDVLIGLVQGAILALFTVFYVSDLFNSPSKSSQAEELSHTSLQENSDLTNDYGTSQ